MPAYSRHRPKIRLTKPTLAKTSKKNPKKVSPTNAAVNIVTLAETKTEPMSVAGAPR